VTSAIIDDILRSDDRSVMQAMGVSGFDEIKKRGIIVGHDNRFLGPEFAMDVIGLLQKHGIKTWYAGEAVTPEFSAGIEMLNAACSINLTPSHNPANYAGFKFNPSDGGPAGAEITTKLEETANRMMKDSAVIHPFKPEKIERIDLSGLYIKYIKERKTIDIEKIREFINTNDCIVCVDNVHGATRGKIQRILGGCSKIKYLRTEDDFLFGGVAPEPSEKNMHGVEKVLRESRANFRLGVIMDPDGDRIRHIQLRHVFFQTVYDRFFLFCGNPHLLFCKSVFGFFYFITYPFNFFRAFVVISDILFINFRRLYRQNSMLST